MSWRVEVPAVEMEEFEKAVNTAFRAAHLEGESAEQCRLARDAAVELVECGAVAMPGHRVAAVLAGHANPGMVAPHGVSSDVVSVTVWQAV